MVYCRRTEASYERSGWNNAFEQPMERREQRKPMLEANVPPHQFDILVDNYWTFSGLRSQLSPKSPRSLQSLRLAFPNTTTAPDRCLRS